MITGITEITHITTKQDMSRWTRAHSEAPGITWSVFAGEGGTMIIVEHTEDRAALTRADVTTTTATAATTATTTVAAVSVGFMAEQPGILTASA